MTQVNFTILLVSICIWLSLKPINSMLYPSESETRTSKRLDALWWFTLEPPNSKGWGFAKKWWLIKLSRFKNATKMPVPSSFNDLSSDKALRDHVGWIWYQTSVFIDKYWLNGCYNNKRIVLRFGSINYFAAVWLNEFNVLNHTGGHLPFETEVCNFVTRNKSLHWITVAVNNTLSHHTIPQAEFDYKTGNEFPSGYFIQSVNFDFFNYAGILRSVYLYMTPKIFIQDITLTTTIKNYDGHVSYSAVISGANNGCLTVATVLNRNGHQRTSIIYGSNGTFIINNARFWWPFGANASVGYLYTLQLSVISETGELLDVYRLEFGIRTVEVRKRGFFINGKRFYFKGCGMHEDFHIIGRGYNDAVMIKDLNLLQWLGANSFRTSHYPYSEERLRECDRRGFVVIGETSAVGLRTYSDEVLNLHRSIANEMINRDKNHPSVVMWSVANEAWGTYKPEVRNYFKTVISDIRNLDPTRPVTMVYGVYQTNEDATADLVDVISLNRYYAWYIFNGHSDVIRTQLTSNINQWYNAYNKPLLISEYGADAVPGLHQLPAAAFTEDYQLEFMTQYHATFNEFLNKSVLIGEMFWNFADFATDQSTIRVLGNKKGVFTRERQPKMSAYLMKYRYDTLR